MENNKSEMFLELSPFSNGYNTAEVLSNRVQEVRREMIRSTFIEFDGNSWDGLNKEDRTEWIKHYYNYDKVDIIGAGANLFFRTFRGVGQGIVSYDGKILRDPVDNEKVEFLNGNFLISKHSTKGVLDNNGNELIPTIYDRVVFYEDYYECVKNEKTSLYTSEGALILDSIPGNRSWKTKVSDETYYMVYRKCRLGTSSFGLFTQKGQEVLPTKYEFIKVYSDGTVVYNLGTGCGILDIRTGKVIVDGENEKVPYIDSSVNGWYGNVFLVEQKGGQGTMTKVMNWAGKIVLPYIKLRGSPAFQIGPFLTLALKDNRSKVVHIPTETVLPQEYINSFDINSLETGALLLRNPDTTIAIYKPDGTSVTDGEFQFADPLRSHYGGSFKSYAVTKNGKQGILDIDKGLIIPCEYSKISMKRALYIAYSADTTVFFNDSGDKMFALAGEQKIKFSSSNMIMTESEDGSCSLYTKNGVLLGERYCCIEEFGRHFKAKTLSDRADGILDESGRVLLEPVYDSLMLIDEKGIILAKQKGNWYLFQIINGKVIPYQPVS